MGTVVRHVRRTDSPTAAARQFLGVWYEPSADGLNEEAGWQTGSYETRIYEEGAFALTLPNLTASDGLSHLERFLITKPGELYRPGYEFVEVYANDGADLLYVGTPVGVPTCSRSTIEVQGSDPLYLLKKVREYYAGFWNHAPRDCWEHYCNPPDAPIWMGDLSFRALGEVEAGDEVIGWSSEAGGLGNGSGNALCRARVLAVVRRQASLVKITLASGRAVRCTPDHQWLVRRGWGKYEFRSASVGDRLAHVVEPSEPCDPAKALVAGWLGGMYDAEGSQRFIAQYPEHNPETYARIAEAATELDLTLTPTPRGYYITGGRQGALDFLNATRPVKREALAQEVLGRLREPPQRSHRFTTPDEVVSIEPDGEGEVVSMATTTGNYIAWGYASKNCSVWKVFAATDFGGGAVPSGWASSHASASPVPSRVRIEPGAPATEGLIAATPAAWEIGLEGANPYDYWQIKVEFTRNRFGSETTPPYGDNAHVRVGLRDVAGPTDLLWLGLQERRSYIRGPDDTPGAPGPAVLQIQTQTDPPGPYEVIVEGRERWIYFFVNQALVGVFPMPLGPYTVAPFVGVVTGDSTSDQRIDVDNFLLRRCQPLLMRDPDTSGDYRLPGAPPPGGLHGRYYNDDDIHQAQNYPQQVFAPSREENGLYSERLDHTLNFTAANGYTTSPRAKWQPPGTPSDKWWSARWTGSIYLELAQADYQLQYDTLQEGARLWIGKTRRGEEYLDNWLFDLGTTQTGGSIRDWLGPESDGGFHDGWYPILIEYGQRGTSGAELVLRYHRGGTVAPPPPPPPPPGGGSGQLGFSTHIRDYPAGAVRDAYVDRLWEAGATVFRDDCPVRAFKPSASTFDPTVPEELCQQAERKGAQLVLQCGYAAAWMNGGHSDDKFGPTSAHMADYGAALAELVEWLEANHPGVVRSIEYWNEPNLVDFLKDPATGQVASPSYYASLCEAAYGQKPAGTTIEYWAGSTSGSLPTLSGGGSWVAAVLSAMVGQAYDAWSCHPYYFVTGASLSTLLRTDVDTGWNQVFHGTRSSNLEDTLAAHGYTGPIHATEWGVPTDAWPSGTRIIGGGFGTTDETTAANYFEQAYPFWTSHARAGLICSYTGQDPNSGDTSTREDHFGGYHSDASAKPIIAKMQAATGGGMPALAETVWTVVPPTMLSPWGIFHDQIRGDSHYEALRTLSSAYGFQLSTEPRKLEDPGFPGVVVPRVRVGRDTDKVLAAAELESYNTAINADDVADALLGDGSGLADDSQGGQLTAEIIDYATAESGPFQLVEYEQVGDIAFAPLLRQRLSSLLALRSSPWEEVSAQPPGFRELRDTFPLTGDLAMLNWQAGDGIRLDLPSIGVVDATPRQILGVTRPFTQIALGAPTIAFRQRPRSLREFLRQVQRRPLVKQRRYQGQYMAHSGSLARLGTSAGIDEVTRVALPRNLSDVKGATLVVYEKADETPLYLWVNGQPTDMPAVTEVGRYDVSAYVARFYDADLDSESPVLRAELRATPS